MNTHTSTRVYVIQERNSWEGNTWRECRDQPDETKVSELAALRWLTIHKERMKEDYPYERYRLQIRSVKSLTIKETARRCGSLEFITDPKTAKK
jgi:hypothetical protein